MHRAQAAAQAKAEQKVKAKLPPAGMTMMQKKAWMKHNAKSI